MDPARPTATTLAVRDGRIAAIGDDGALQALAGPRTRLLDLEGRSLLPGFQDAHVHPTIGGWAMLTCELHDVAWDRAAYLDRIAAYAAAHPADAWIVGGGWAMPAFPGGTPSRRDLDAVAPGRPIFLENRDGHGAWVSTPALELAGLTADTRDPADGRIEREADGTPQGTLHEGAADLVRALVPAWTAAQWEAAILAAQRHLHGFGITAVTDAWATAEHVPAYRALAERGQLTLRTTLSLWWDRSAGLEQLERLDEMRRTATVGRLRASTVKLMLDGVLESFTGALLDPYLDAGGRPTDNRGIAFIDPGGLAAEIAPALDAAGFQLHFHAIGDRAVRAALDTVEAVRRLNGPSARRPHIAHLQLVDPSDLPRFGALGVGATIQPVWAVYEAQMRDLTIPFLGPERSARQYPFRSLERAGARLIGGSDWSVSTPDVLEEVEVAVNRVAKESRGIEPPFLPDERIDLESAMRAFTIGAAWANGLDAETGTLAPGKLADLVVLDRDVFDRGAGEIGDARVLLTLSEGTAVHADPVLGW